MTWGHDFAFPFLPGSAPPSSIWLHKCLHAVKKNQMFQCKTGTYSCKTFLNFDSLFTFLAMKRWEMGEETSKTTCTNNNKKLSTYDAFFTASPCGEPLAEALSRSRITDGEGQTAGGITVAGCGERNVRLPLQAPVTAAGLTFALDVTAAWQAVSILQTDALQMDMPCHPAALRLPLGNEPFPQWVPSPGGAGALVEFPRGGLPCAEPHCTVLACCWVPCCGHNVLTNPQCV